MDDPLLLHRPIRTDRPRRLTRTVAALAVALTLGASCSQGADGADSPVEPGGDEAAAEDVGDGDASRDEGDSGDSGEASGEDRDQGVLGSSTGQLPAAPLDGTTLPLRVDVTSLERQGDLVELRITVTNEGAPDGPEFEPYGAFDDPRLGGDGLFALSGAALVDGEGQKAYLTVIDSEGVCLCTGNMAAVGIAGGQTMEMYATFGGVPDDVERVDVSIPGFGPVANVPIGG